MNQITLYFNQSWIRLLRWRRAVH